MGSLASEFADLSAVHLSAEVDLAVGVLSKWGEYHSVDEFGVVGEIGTDGTNTD